MSKRLCGLFVALLASASLFAQANGKLQLHFMDVGQGDGAVLVSPKGQVVLFDAGMDTRLHNCDKVTSEIRRLGVQHIDYVFISHYHSDHIGCIPQVLAEAPLAGTAYDRGASYAGATYTRYAAAVSGKRVAAKLGDTIKLDAGTAGEIELRVISVNGDGAQTTNENDLSLSVLVRSGAFVAEIGGDLSGQNTGDYKDIETGVAPRAGRLDVYKVHHHCSAYSSNDTWLSATQPTLAVISTGDGNDYHHPAQSCLDRLRAHDIPAYWTETGAGGAPESGDVVGGTVSITLAPGAAQYDLATTSGVKKSYNVIAKAAASTGGTGAKLVPPTPAETGLKYTWSKTKSSKVYHYSECSVVASIDASNLVHGDTPPEGRTLHSGCPTGQH